MRQRAALLSYFASVAALSVPAVPTERKWGRASPGEEPPQRAARLLCHKEHQARQKARRLARLDALLDRAHASLGDDWTHCTPAVPCGQYGIDWTMLPPGCDPCAISVKMAPGTARGERKRESIDAMAWLLSTFSLSTASPTIVDAGCGTGSLLLPLAALFPNATFVGIDYKKGSLQRLRVRADEAGDDLSRRVVTWHGRIEDYDGPLDALLSLHACGGASDAALTLASERNVPYGVSPCCIGKLRRGPSSSWLRDLLLTQSGCGADPLAAEVNAAKSFALLASWADSEHVGVAAYGPSGGRKGSPAGHGHDTVAVAATRRHRCKTLVELDRLIALSETQATGRGEAIRPGVRPGRLLRIPGEAMATSGQAELLTCASAHHH